MMVVSANSLSSSIHGATVGHAYAAHRAENTCQRSNLCLASKGLPSSSFFMLAVIAPVLHSHALLLSLPMLAMSCDNPHASFNANFRLPVDRLCQNMLQPAKPAFNTYSQSIQSKQQCLRTFHPVQYLQRFTAASSGL